MERRKEKQKNGTSTSFLFVMTLTVFGVILIKLIKNITCHNITNYVEVLVAVIGLSISHLFR